LNWPLVNLLVPTWHKQGYEPASRSEPGSRGGLRQQRLQRFARDHEPSLDELLRALEAAVLVLDRQHVVVPDGVQRGDEARPVDLPESGQPRHLPADATRERAVAVEPV